MIISCRNSSHYQNCCDFILLASHLRKKPNTQIPKTNTDLQCEMEQFLKDSNHLPSVVSVLACFSWFGFCIVCFTFLECTALFYIISVWWDRGMFLSCLPHLREKEVGWEAPLHVMLLHKSIGLFCLPDLTCALQFSHLQHPPRTSGRIGWQDTHTPMDLEIQQEESNKHIFKDCRTLQCICTSEKITFG